MGAGVRAGRGALTNYGESGVATSRWDDPVIWEGRRD